MLQTQSVRAAPAASQAPAGERFSRWAPISRLPSGPSRLVELGDGAAELSAMIIALGQPVPLAHRRPALQEISGAVEELGQLLERPSGHVRITASRSAARMVIAPALPKFVQSYPEIVVEVLIEPAFTDIVARRFDAGIRLGESLEKDVVAVPVTGPLRMAVVGAPHYFAKHPAPATPHDLRKHRCINIRLPAAGTIYKWEFEQGRRAVEVGVDGPLIFDDEGMVIDAALAGLGLAYLIEDQAASQLQAGTLTRVLEDWCEPFPGFFLYYPGRRQLSPALAALIDAIRVPAKARKGR